MIEAEWWDYDSVDELAEAVGGDVGFIIDSALDARAAALVALPVDGLSQQVFPTLAAAKLKWKQAAIVPADDFIVGVEDERSKARALAKAFLPVGARVVPIVTAIPDHKAAGNAADARLQELPWPPDLVWLSVGVDGNAAGIASGADLQDALDAPKARRAVGVMPESGEPRVTLTRASILAARTVLITVQGKEAREVLEGAIADGQSSKLPIGRVLAEAEQPIDIHWVA
ncbi:6-phosphogluconolactonase [Sphingomonas sinipercae]|uniref:6-phosphogluconolactonase n=1 Tax=Sphingomonas sinipercae TaxID=2714944 RepID=A0A6G7ZKI9_9SPHN|nr:6-phosphogluconolactonase [Sphingomonas sinipercae]QIL01439.1 6-phosphogluconolactonase [Sphingomonas sinipercae]